MNNYLVLYRKYRPQRFADVIGQEHVVKTLTNAILRDNISHAYLFAGPRGSGKTTIARLFVKAINCEKRDGFEPCNTCSSCKEIMEFKSIDLIELDAASHTGIDEIREIIEGSKFASVKSKYKAFIIDECHQLSKSAANALLKTLEEPPPRVIFLLATTEPHKMIPTIVSRCQRFDFRRLQIPEIIRKLEFIAQKENVEFERSALSLIALNSRGSFRDAESLLDQCLNFISSLDKNSRIVIKSKDVRDLLGMAEINEVARFVDVILSKDAKEAITFLNSLLESGLDLQEFLKTLIFYFRQILLIKIHPYFLKTDDMRLVFEEAEKMKEQAGKFSLQELQKIIETLVEAENKMKYSFIFQLPLELAVLKIISGKFGE